MIGPGERANLSEACQAVPPSRLNGPMAAGVRDINYSEQSLRKKSLQAMNMISCTLKLVVCYDAWPRVVFWFRAPSPLFTSAM